eukprot:CAMPEP_0117751950 /NCGR_PEP_ID=MMETSP0947-20121206/11294_1 /TAXON_ID=44440 /ORGANISM="Chattonella subsalsa, Strain CCMP2191" /LENGTH=327 /DNA_ID=CAMNT_0005570457 /DNA_START=129 /DNA_END=1112 /DNA_ORIENTATION=+
MATVKFDKLGSAPSVLKIGEDDDLGQLSSSEVGVKMLAAAVTPADFAMIAGLGDVRPALPGAVGGLSGVGEVTAVGAGVSGLQVGDKVVPLSPAFGCWRSQGKADAGAVAKVPSDLPLESAASFLASSCVAYRLLSDFATLKAGDVVVQNGAESAVGQDIIKFAKKNGLKTVNIVSSADAASALNALGADVVITEAEAATMAGREALSKLKAPSLAVNTVGGASVMSMAKALEFEGTLVTYGGLSRRAVEIPTPSFIFNGISARGFTLSRWLAFASPDEVSAMVSSVTDMVKSTGPSNVSSFSFSEFNKAIEAASEAGIASNVVVKM